VQVFELSKSFINAVYKNISMKKYLILLITLSFVTTTIQAQVDVKLRINHKSGSQDFKFNDVVTAKDGYNIRFTRLQYYISKIKLIHDNGKETVLEDVYLLENAGMKLTHDLGNFDIKYLEGIKFSIGVDNGPNPNPNDPSNNTTNHADPNLWPNSHALALKSPRMHWGWSAGYRFVCMEGFSGPSTNFSCEMHALGDANYHEVDLVAGAEIINNEMVIEINADYLESLYNVNMSSGFYLHSVGGKAVTFLKNFQQRVFSASMEPIKNTTGVGSIKGHDYQMKFQPNPSDGPIKVTFKPKGNSTYLFQVFNLQGKLIEKYELNGSNAFEIEGLSVGIYHGVLLENNEAIDIQKMVIIR
tara:strand:+ start:6534 stop:7607 length:1074 start_codon:yes stop_codon:yes gene_type:complete